ncbi:MAG: SCO6880 family protein [Rhodococcus sp. (in: high G+C Gram-positive bacteria)]
MTSEHRAPTTYGAWRLPRSGGAFGVSFAVTILGMAFAVAVIGTYAVTRSLSASGLVLAVGAVLIVPMVMNKDGQSGHRRFSGWRTSLLSNRRGEDTYASGAFSKVPGGVLRLPGVLAGTDLYEGIDSAGRTFSMIHLPDTHYYTVQLAAEPQGGENFDQEHLDRAVANWGQQLGGFGDVADIPVVAAVLETVPDTGTVLMETVRARVRRDAPELARQSMYETATGTAKGGVRMAARLAITFQAQTDERRKDPIEQAVEIARRLPEITAAAAAAGVICTPMTADEVAGTVRRSYDPSALEAVEAALYSGQGTGLSWSDCGPRTTFRKRDRYFHDGAVSVTWEMRVAPKRAVTERVLERLIRPHAELPHKRVTILYRVHPAGEAADVAASDYRNARARRSGRTGLDNMSDVNDERAASLAQQEQSLGHGMTRFAILVTVTGPAETTDVPRIDAILRDVSVQALLSVRRSHYWQDAAFAVGLGIGVSAPEHTSLPRLADG